MAESLEEKVARHGDKMMEIRVRLWTDSIASEPGKVVPKHAWDSGVVYLQTNRSHGVTPSNPVPFNGFADLQSKIEKVLIDGGVKVHLSKKQKRYLIAD